MKKIGYFISFMMLLLIPGVCNALENTVPTTISDIKVEYLTGEEKDTIQLSFKVLKDLDFDNGYIDVWADTTDETSVLHLYSDLDFKIAQNGSCDNAVEITDKKVENGLTVCASKEVEKNVKIKENLSIGIQYSNESSIYEENIKYDATNESVSSVKFMDITYAENMVSEIKKHYDGHIDIGMGSLTYGFAYAFIYDPTIGFNEEENIVCFEEGIAWDMTKDLDYYTNIIDGLIAKAGIKFDVKVEENKMEKDLLSLIKATKQTVEYETKKDDKVVYSWVFDGAQMDNIDFNIDLSLKIGESENKTKIEELVKDKENSLVLEFGYHGELPKGTSVKVNVSDTYKDNDLLSLYYYNDEGKLELISKDIKVKNGLATLNLEHCSEYVLVKNEVETAPEETTPEETDKDTTPNDAPNNAQTSSMNIVFYIVLAISSLIGITYILIKKKKIA